MNWVYSSVPLSGQRDICPIELHSAVEYDAPIYCTTCSVPLDGSQSQYKALSYVCGTEQASNKANLNGAPITLQANLDQALRRLRINNLRCCNQVCPCQDSSWPGETDHTFMALTTFLAIDGVCINQIDTAEKDWQVTLMGDIFGSASEVILWIDEVSDHSSTASRFLHALAELYDGKKRTEVHCSCTSPSMSATDALG